MTYPIQPVSKKPRVESDIDLTQMNTLGVTARAKVFVNIKEPGELRALHEEGFFEKHSPVFLGGGSNMLLLNNPGQPVLKISISGKSFVDQQDGRVLLKAGAGENWHKLVESAVKHDLGGIENLALIPGTTGAAPIQNIGAYGVELEDYFVELTAFNIRSGQFEVFSREECRFGYRDSIFKHELKGKRIIIDVTLRLTKDQHQVNLSYGALADYLNRQGVKSPGINDVFEAVVKIRQSKLPDPAKIGNAGSFFKNPVVEINEFERLRAEYPEMPFYELGEGRYKIPAAWFIEQAGWKGKREGNVGTYKNQALVLVNLGGATGEEIYRHAMRIRDSVQEKFGIDLNPEVNIIGAPS